VIFKVETAMSRVLTFPQELVRWSALIFAVAFSHSAFLQTTLQFPYVRKHIPPIFTGLLPFFVIWIFFCNVTAIVLLYVAVVALDLRPELYHTQPPVIVPIPYISAHGNRIPAYVICAGVVVVGYPWFLAVWRTIHTTLSRRKSVGGFSP
jgi:hypothetical protein